MSSHLPVKPAPRAGEDCGWVPGFWPKSVQPPRQALKHWRLGGWSLVAIRLMAPEARVPGSGGKEHSRASRASMQGNGGSRLLTDLVMVRGLWYVVPSWGG